MGTVVDAEFLGVKGKSTNSHLLPFISLKENKLFKVAMSREQIVESVHRM